MIKRHGYCELANTLAVASLEGVVRGQDGKFFLLYDPAEIFFLVNSTIYFTFLHLCIFITVKMME
jgi:hypothetical protein